MIYLNDRVIAYFLYHTPTFITAVIRSIALMSLPRPKISLNLLPKI